MTDPRYDPRYQRGWNGEPGPAPLATGSAPSEPVAPSPSASTDSPRGDGDEAPAPAPPDPGVEDAAPQPDPESDVPRARNPFLIALVTLGGVLIVAAAGMLWQLTRPISSTDPVGYIGPQVESMVAPWILLAGIFCMIAAISLGAVRRR